ncbi:putative toxin-antitoxin system toxin component, PIN family [Phycisphaerales bacterium AB-hyl4]|uniref:Toxin-antitoxin system toxin component, PIN family n=1 Tax=Natronomicrosphaera hydrolytica TaxID=3242702 RepID=A0ABV4U7G5_9BACT
MRIVLDTNVLVAGLLSPNGPPAQVLQLLLSERVRLCYDARILGEYREVLARPRFGFDPEAVAEVLTFLEQTGELVAAVPLGVVLPGAVLPDPDDAMFLEVAAAGRVDSLVTGNIKHFPARHRHGVRVMNPAAWVRAVLSS